MAATKSSLSAGTLIYAVLRENPGVMERARKVYPVVEDEAELPYIVYRRVRFEKNPVKTGRGADTVTIEVQCLAKGYEESVELAEAVLGALDGMQIEHEGLVMRACDLTDSSEDWVDDAYVQSLVFTCKM